MRSGLQRESLAAVQHLIEIALDVHAGPRGRELDEAHPTAGLGRGPDVCYAEPRNLRSAPRQDRLAQAQPIDRVDLAPQIEPLEK